MPLTRRLPDGKSEPHTQPELPTLALNAQSSPSDSPTADVLSTLRQEPDPSRTAVNVNEGKKISTKPPRPEIRSDGLGVRHQTLADAAPDPRKF